jgi:uncharacterized membrane protein
VREIGQDIRRTADSDLVHAGRTIAAMTQIDGRPEGDAEHMPVHWWSIQWKTSRLFYALVAGIVVTRNFDPNEPVMLFGSILIVAAVVFLALTAVALYYRRRWAREHS